MIQETGGLTEREPSLDRDGRAAYRVEGDDRDVGTTIVRAVADVADCDVLAGERVLYDVIDPDALEQLFADRCCGTAETVGKVVFELRGCRVEVRADGEVVVYEPADCREKSQRSAAKSA